MLQDIYLKHCQIGSVFLSQEKNTYKIVFEKYSSVRI